MLESFDIGALIIGAGPVGLACAYTLAHTHPLLDIVVIDRAKSFDESQAARSSGVIHAGWLYKAGTRKARTCVRGNELLYDFCKQQRIPHKRTGGIVVATEPQELATLEH